jgi:hypothetical protein
MLLWPPAAHNVHQCYSVQLPGALLQQQAALIIAMHLLMPSAALSISSKIVYAAAAATRRSSLPNMPLRRLTWQSRLLTWQH